jgi:hypothetical protein
VERRQACALRKSARRIARCGGGYPAFAGVPLPSFFLRSPGERSETRGAAAKPHHRSRISLRSSGLRNGETRNGTLKGRPTPALSLDRTGFALDVTAFCWRAIRSRFARIRSVTSSRSWRSEREWIPVPGAPPLSAPAKRGRGTTGARVASEPWWRGRWTRSFVFVAGNFSSQGEASEHVRISSRLSRRVESCALHRPFGRSRRFASAFFT